MLYAEIVRIKSAAFPALLKNKGVSGDGYRRFRNFYRIIDKFIDQTGPVHSKGVEVFADDDYGLYNLKQMNSDFSPYELWAVSEYRGHFSIVVAPAPHLDTHYDFFGEVVAGDDIVWAINALDKKRNRDQAWPSLKTHGEL